MMVSPEFKSRIISINKTVIDRNKLINYEQFKKLKYIHIIIDEPFDPTFVTHFVSRKKPKYKVNKKASSAQKRTNGQGFLVDTT